MFVAWSFVKGLVYFLIKQSGHGGQAVEEGLHALCRHAGGWAEVRLPGGTARLRVLLDTGNTLTDPLTNRPVLVAEGAALERVLPRNFPWWDPVRGVEQAAVQGLRGVRLLPYRAVGVDCGMLLAVKSQGITLEGRDLGPLLVALSPTPVSDGGNYQALLGAE